MSDLSRRPLRTRDTKWARNSAAWLASKGLTPNSISVASVFFAALGGLALFLAGRSSSGVAIVAAYVSAIVGIQGRLLCNLFDGLVAIEGGRKTKSGELFNELPDRISDVLILLGAGFSIRGNPWLPHLGWGAAVISLIVAYVRALGASAGAGQCFLGPMAKPHRMAVVTGACVVAIAGLPWGWNDEIVAGALVLIIAGGLVTTVRRTVAVVRTLEAS